MLLNSAKKLRDILNEPGIVMAPGIYDGISAKVCEDAGFKAAYLSGAGISVGYLGEPDIGFINGSDVAEVARHISANRSIPFMADADTGYGNALNVIRTVWDLEQAGCAAIQIEDQVAPKRCGHLNGKQCIDSDEFALKVKAAAKEKSDPDTIIIARTDARAVYDLDEALRRGEKYLDAGADVLFIEAPQTIEEIEKITSTFKGTYLLTNQVIGGKTPKLTAKEAEDIGYKIIIYPDALPYMASVMFRRACDRIMETGQSWDVVPDANDSRELFMTMGMKEWRDKEPLYATNITTPDKLF